MQESPLEQTTLGPDGGPFGPVTTFAPVSATSYAEQGATAPLGVWDPFGLVSALTLP